jgi:hypothetical protein
MFFVTIFTGLALSLYSSEGKTDLIALDSSNAQSEQSAPSKAPAARMRTASKNTTGPAAKVPVARAPITDTNAPCLNTDGKIDPSSYVQFGANYTWTWIKPKGLHSTWGNTGGQQVSYEYKSPNRPYGGVTFAWRSGNTDNNDDNMERSLCYIDVQERIGYTLSQCQKWTCSLFTGFGYRHYGEDVTSGPDLVTFEYNEFYVPIGILLEAKKMNGRTSVGLNAIWMPQAYPTVKIVPLQGARWILTNEWANFRVEFPITWHFSQKYHGYLSVVPLFEYWTDGETTAKTELGTSLNIPSNTYMFAGVNLNFGYCF